MITHDHYDCIVIGGGPAGCTAAALLAEAGHSTLLVEREQVPRFHVGESLMPEIYWIFQRLGLLEKMKSSDFVEKYSVQFVNHSGRESQPFFFDQHDPRDCSRTWQVERGKFDKMLFDHAADKGADCRDQTRVTDVCFDDNKRFTSVQIQTAAGESKQISGRVLIDATGQQALLANRLKLRNDNPRLRKASIWTYFNHARRDPGKHGGATIILHTEKKDSWFWFIPLANDVTSVGVVADHEYLLKERESVEATFAQELAICPAMEERLASATQIDNLHIAKEFSYSTTQQAGDGWVLTGDAYGFIDPIYSSGVYFAMKSGELAADAIVEGFSKDDLSASQLGNWSAEFDAGTNWIRKLVDKYYTNEFSFGKFMKEFPQHQGNLTDLLIGRIFHEGAGNIFNDMDPAMAKALDEANID
jgi:geranylgeranyl reductase family protein